MMNEIAILRGEDKLVCSKKSKVRSLVVVTICVDAVSVAMNENEFYELLVCFRYALMMNEPKIQRLRSLIF